MTQFFVFKSEEEAEAFCTEGCPIYGKDLDGNEVRDKGVTVRLAEWKKHPTEEKWLVRQCDELTGKEAETVELDDEVIYPKVAIEEMTRAYGNNH